MVLFIIWIALTLIYIIRLECLLESLYLSVDPYMRYDIFLNETYTDKKGHCMKLFWLRRSRENQKKAIS